MARRKRSSWAAEQAHQPISCFDSGHLRARLTWAASFVDLSSSNTSYANSRPLCAPDRTISVPYSRGRASEALPSGHDRLKKEQEHHEPMLAYRIRVTSVSPYRTHDKRDECVDGKIQKYCDKHGDGNDKADVKPTCCRIF